MGYTMRSSDYKRFMGILEQGLHETASLMLLHDDLRRREETKGWMTQFEKMIDEKAGYYQRLAGIYGELSGKKPILNVKKLPRTKSKDDLKQAVLMQLDAADLYREGYGLTPSSRIRGVFLHAMSCELSHASRCTLLLQSL